MIRIGLQHENIPTTSSRAATSSKVTIFALGIMPYISASIILQLLTVVWPYLEKLSKEGELGRRKITQYTRYGTSFCRGAGGRHRVRPRASERCRRTASRLHPGLGFRLMTLAHADHRHGVHHVARRADHRARHRQRHFAHHFRRHRVGLPRAVLQTLEQMRTGQIGLIQDSVSDDFCGLLSWPRSCSSNAVIGGSPLQYAKRVVGRRMYGGSSTHIPLKVNTGGGIAGLAIAELLQRSGASVVLIEKNKTLCSEASGEQQGWFSYGRSLYSPSRPVLFPGNGGKSR